jgi:hypothetical protein
VDLLWVEGNVVGALKLEGLWRELQRQVDFSLLCAYDSAHLGARGRAVLGRVHDHVV